MGTEKALRYLSQAPVLHMDMLEGLRRGLARVVRADGDGVLLINEGADIVMASAPSEEAAGRLAKAAPAAGMFVVHQNFLLGPLREKYSRPQTLACRQAAFLGNRPLPAPASGVEIRPLGEEALPFVLLHYAHADDPDYLRERLRAGALWGAYSAGRLAGFAGTHAEGSIGMLEVLPEYRRQKIGLSLAAFLAARQFSEGFTPFSQIIVGNEPSLALHRKLGFTVSEQTIAWLY